MEAAYGLVMRFLDGSESFCNGYECGLLDRHMAVGDSIENQAVHTANVEQIKMLANRYNYSAEFQPSDFEEWTFFTGAPGAGAEARRKKIMVIEGGLSETKD